MRAGTPYVNGIPITQPNSENGYVSDSLGGYTIAGYVRSLILRVEHA
jgi:hypothetical protein